MFGKQIVFDEDARQQVLVGISALSAAVKVTLGPKGRNVMIDRNRRIPRMTKDGVTVARQITFADPIANVGALMARQVASKTNQEAGDGTTASVILLEAIYREGLGKVVGGLNPIQLKRGIDRAVDTVVTELRRLARPIAGSEEIRSVAVVAANWDRAIGEMVADAIEKAGPHGTVAVEEARSIESTLDVVEGTQFDKGYMSPYFATERESMEAILEEAHVLVHEKKITSAHALIPLLQEIERVGKPLLIIAENIEAEALAILVVNHLRGNIRVCAVKAPGFGDHRKKLLEDLAILTGSQFLSPDLGLALENIELKDLGTAACITVTKDQTTILQGGGEATAIQARIARLQQEIQRSPGDYDREKLEERLGKLSGGVAVIHVGAATEVELKEKKDRIDDALHATRAAVEEGIVPGGGIALMRTIPALEKVIDELVEDEKVGASIVRRALEEPLRQLCMNAGVDDSLIVGTAERQTGAMGYNITTGLFENLLKAGVIDPAKVVRCSLKNAASIAGLLLTTEAIITETPS